MNHLVRLESAIQDAFLNKQHLIAVFFDLEKAYDTTWRYGILRTLYGWGIKGHLGNFINHFLSERYFQVRIGNTLSNVFAQENGVPQGSVLSVTLFSIAINGIIESIPTSVQSSLYVDDLAIYCSSKYVRTAQRHLQLAINSIQHWATDNGFKFSSEKTQCVHFCRTRSCYQEPFLYFQAL